MTTRCSRRYGGKWPRQCSREATTGYKTCGHCRARGAGRDQHDRPSGRSGRHRPHAYLKWRYGITWNDYEGMFERQGGVCAICRKGRQGNARRLCIDHNHKTGQVRALLCVNCNKGLGHFYENESVLLAAIAYLRTHGDAMLSQTP